MKPLISLKQLIFRQFLGFLTLVCCSYSVKAQVGVGEGAEPPGRELETVTVTSRRSIAQRFLAAGSMVVVDRRDIENLGADNLGEVLRQLPSVQVTPSADGGVEIRMRGMDKNATQILVDGQRVSSGRTQLPLDQIPTELIERIEVVRAPTAQHSGAAGGTLNFVLRQAQVKKETTIRLTDNHVWGKNAGQLFFSQTGPLGSGQASSPSKKEKNSASESKSKEMTPAASAPTVSAELSGVNVTQASIEATAKEAVTPTELNLQGTPWSYFVAVSGTGMLLGSDVHRETSATALSTSSDTAYRFRRQEWVLTPRLTGRLSATDQLNLRATLGRSHFLGNSYFTGSSESASGATTQSATDASDRRRNFLQLGGDWIHRFDTSKLETSVNLSSARDDTQREGLSSSSNGVSSVSSDYFYNENRKDRSDLISLKWSGTDSPLVWSMGLESEHKHLSLNSLKDRLGLLSNNIDLKTSTKRDEIWGQNEWEVFGNATLTTGLRLEAFSISGDGSALTSKNWNAVQPSLHLRKPFDEDSQIRVNLARISRYPSVTELADVQIPSLGVNTINNPDQLGNPSVQPERTITADLGYERKLGSQGQIGFNFLYRRQGNAIVSVTDFSNGRWFSRPTNVGDAEVFGLEVDVKSELTWMGLSRDWALSANASVLQSKMLNGINAGNRLPGQPRYLLNVNVAKPLRRTGGWFGGVSMSLAGPSDFNSSPGITGTQKARSSLDIFLGRVVTGLGYWRIGIYNIGDAPYIRRSNYNLSSQGSTDEYSRIKLTPRIYVSIGIQF